MTEPGTRESPMWRHFILWALFLILVVVGVFQVLLPELEDDNPEGSASETTEAPAE